MGDGGAPNSVPEKRHYRHGRQRRRQTGPTDTRDDSPARTGTSRHRRRHPRRVDRSQIRPETHPQTLNIRRGSRHGRCRQPCWSGNPAAMPRSATGAVAARAVLPSQSARSIGWFTAATVRRWLPARYLPWWRVITRAQAERIAGCVLATYPLAEYTKADLRARRRR